MKYYVTSKQMDLSDRIAIETGLCRGESFKKIAKMLKRHPSTIAHEVKENRTFIHGNYMNGKDCKFVRNCRERQLCGCDDYACNAPCRLCKGVDCRTICTRYISVACHKHDTAPYVCNTCKNKKLCTKDKYVYSAKFAEAAVTRRRSESRQGIRISAEQKKELDEFITKLVKKGQPLSHIYAEHENEMPVCLRTLYNYIDAGEMTIRNVDLRRKTGYRPRKRKYADVNNETLRASRFAYRKERTYTDFENVLNIRFAEAEVVEMDTVKGVRETGKRLLTMIFRRNNVMLLFLMPDGKAESVKRVFDYLEVGLGIERFWRLFPVFLTDNGSEFKRVGDLEFTDDLENRTTVYYCDPMASWQKGCLEKNHEFIRYAIPRGKSLNSYTQGDITLLMNHINSVKRPGLGNKSPYELIDAEDEDFQTLMELLKMHLIPPDEVHLTPELFVKK